MPKWIHERAQHLMSKNPDMGESTAWAIATQQAHATGKSPKGYGTPQGRRKAKAKFDKPKEDYVQTAKSKQAGLPIADIATDVGKWIGRKITNADRLDQLAAQITKQQGQIHNIHLGAGALGAAGAGALIAKNMSHQPAQPAPVMIPVPMAKPKVKAASAVDGYSLAVFSGFSDEMQKISGAVGEALKTFGHYVAGGPKTDLIHTVPAPQGRISKLLGRAPDYIEMHLPGHGPRVGSGVEALSDPKTRGEAAKVMGARAVAGAGVLGLGALAAGAEHPEGGAGSVKRSPKKQQSQNTSPYFPFEYFDE